MKLTSIGEAYGFDGRGRYAHTGMIKAAEWIYKQLESNEVDDDDDDCNDDDDDDDDDCNDDDDDDVDDELY